MRSNGIMDILNMLWFHRKRILMNCIGGGVIAVVIAFSIPKEYTATVVLAPELSQSTSMTGGIGSLASLAGVDLNLMDAEDALYPELYPQIVSSTPFLCDLMSVQVNGNYRNEPISVDLYHYLKDCQRLPWWEWLSGIPGRLRSKSQSTPADSLAPACNSGECRLSRRQQLLIKALDRRISVSVDKGTSVITLSVTMQDPVISADVARNVSVNLQEYICNYRSAKARQDLEAVNRLYLDARESFFDIQRKYAEYSDQHQNVTKMKYQIEMDRLENEKELAFGVYNQLSSQLAMAKAKVQEQTPVCVTIQPAVVPFKASHPQKLMIGLLFVLLAFFGTAAWYIVSEGILPESK